MNAKIGDKSAHWFMDGYPGVQIDSSLTIPGDEFVWREKHMPNALCDYLCSAGVTKRIKHRKGRHEVLRLGGLGAGVGV